MSIRATALGALGYLAAVSAFADFNGRVVSVQDGDTITVRAGIDDTRVRLVGIDAPERGQAYGTAARRALATRVNGRIVLVVERGVDSYGRTLGQVFVGPVDVNAALVRSGYAWVFRRFENDPALLALEAEARAERRGLWRSASPVPPWIWRERNTERAPVPPIRDPGSPSTMPSTAP